MFHRPIASEHNVVDPSRRSCKTISENCIRRKAGGDGGGREIEYDLKRRMQLSG